MDLLIPTSDNTGYEVYEIIDSNLFAIEGHTHETIKIKSASINITTTLVVGFKVINTASMSYRSAINRGSALSLYAMYNEFWLRTLEQDIRLTYEGGFNSALLGGIAGDYVSSDASIYYDAANKKYIFYKDFGNLLLGSVSTGAVKLYDTDASDPTNHLTIKADDETDSYTITMFDEAVSQNSIVGVDEECKLITNSSDGVVGLNTTGFIGLTPDYSNIQHSTENALKAIQYNFEGVLGTAGTSGYQLPVGSTAERPVALHGMLRVNTNGVCEMYWNGVWKALADIHPESLALQACSESDFTYPVAEGEVLGFSGGLAVPMSIVNRKASDISDLPTDITDLSQHVVGDLSDFTLDYESALPTYIIKYTGGSFQLAPDEGDTAVWGNIIGDIENQGDVWGAIQGKATEDDLEGLIDKSDIRNMPDVANQNLNVGDTLVFQAGDPAMWTFAQVDGGSEIVLTTKGDIWVGEEVTPDPELPEETEIIDSRLPVGTDGQALFRDDAETTGLRWDTSPSVDIDPCSLKFVAVEGTTPSEGWLIRDMPQEKIIEVVYDLTKISDNAFVEVWVDGAVAFILNGGEVGSSHTKASHHVRYRIFNPDLQNATNMGTVHDLPYTSDLLLNTELTDDSWLYGVDSVENAALNQGYIYTFTEGSSAWEITLKEFFIPDRDLPTRVGSTQVLSVNIGEGVTFDFFRITSDRSKVILMRHDRVIELVFVDPADWSQGCTVNTLDCNLPNDNLVYLNLTDYSVTCIDDGYYYRTYEMQTPDDYESYLLTFDGDAAMVNSLKASIESALTTEYLEWYSSPFNQFVSRKIYVENTNTVYLVDNVTPLAGHVALEHLDQASYTSSGIYYALKIQFSDFKTGVLSDVTAIGHVDILVNIPYFYNNSFYSVRNIHLGYNIKFNNSLLLASKMASSDTIYSLANYNLIKSNYTHALPVGSGSVGLPFNLALFQYNAQFYEGGLVVHLTTSLGTAQSILVKLKSPYNLSTYEYTISAFVTKTDFSSSTWYSYGLTSNHPDVTPSYNESFTFRFCSHGLISIGYSSLYDRYIVLQNDHPYDPTSGTLLGTYSATGLAGYTGIYHFRYFYIDDKYFIIKGYSANYLYVYEHFNYNLAASKLKFVGITQNFNTILADIQSVQEYAHSDKVIYIQYQSIANSRLQLAKIYFDINERDAEGRIVLSQLIDVNQDAGDFSWLLSLDHACGLSEKTPYGFFSTYKPQWFTSQASITGKGFFSSEGNKGDIQ